MTSLEVAQMVVDLHKPELGEVVEVRETDNLLEVILRTKDGKEHQVNGALAVKIKHPDFTGVYA